MVPPVPLTDNVVVPTSGPVMLTVLPDTVAWIPSACKVALALIAAASLVARPVVEVELAEVTVTGNPDKLALVNVTDTVRVPLPPEIVTMALALPMSSAALPSRLI